MIIRILNEGQYRLDDGHLDELNRFDDALEAAVADGDEERLRATLTALLTRIRELGEEVPVLELVDSDLILPAADSGLDELRDALGADGLLPG